MKRAILPAMACVMFAGCALFRTATLQDVMQRADMLSAAGEANKAVELLDSAMERQAFRDSRPDLVAKTLDVLIAAGRVEEAEKRALSSMSDAVLARYALVPMMRYYLSTNNLTATRRFVELAVETPIDASLKERCYAAYLGKCGESKDEAAVLLVVPGMIRNCAGATARRLLDGIFQARIGASELDAATRFADGLDAIAALPADLKSMVAARRIEIALQRGDLAGAEKDITDKVRFLRESDYVHALEAMVNSAKAKRKYDVADRVCERVIKGGKEKREKVVRAAAIGWMDSARTREDAAEVQKRAVELFQSGVSANVMCDLMWQHYYWILGRVDKTKTKAMVVLADGIRAGLASKEQAADLQAVVLDGAFLTDDYARALTILKEGIPNRDKEWHETAICKIQAHKDLSEGRKKEAIVNFRKFMDSVAKTEMQEEDPTTGIVFTREMCLGKNAKRIGDIYASMGSRNDARKAYDEARGYYEKAVKTAKQGSPEERLIRAEMGAIP